MSWSVHTETRLVGSVLRKTRKLYPGNKIKRYRTIRSKCSFKKNIYICNFRVIYLSREKSIYEINTNKLGCKDDDGYGNDQSRSRYLYYCRAFRFNGNFIFEGIKKKINKKTWGRNNRKRIQAEKKIHERVMERVCIMFK